MQVVHDDRGVDPWIQQMFSTRAARRGAVVRRSMCWVDREVGRDTFLREVRRRGCHVIQTADQFIVICHDGPIRLLF
ncbi:N-(5'-phosphoribosyl)anthranilate isomerase [Marinibacterium sp. SX1]|uniref:N-(5'-phosphoribosyl)anthranilate isomerase n=1 Tax=Marinibacterium sp. SX1 TaxID=3388424 RepID=UPI003D182602